MSAHVTEEHLDLILGKIDEDLRAKFSEAVESAEGDECITSLTYKVEIDAAKPKRDGKTSKEPKQKKPVVTLERRYKPAPVNEKDELLTPKPERGKGGGSFGVFPVATGARVGLDSD